MKYFIALMIIIGIAVYHFAPVVSDFQAKVNARNEIIASIK